MNNRDFKGVWIPKEIWLNEELSIIDKVILTEIDSLDNENHCTAGNEYFAKFCNCSESTVTKSIKKLQEMGLIEMIDFNGRKRTLRSSIVNFTKQHSKFYEAAPEILRSINIDNNQTIKSIISKDIIENNGSQPGNFLGSIKTQQQPSNTNKVDKFLGWYKSYNNLPDIRAISDARKKGIIRILDKYTEDDIKTVLKNFNESDFLLGKVSDFKANLDWMLNENNFIKILEGKYNNHGTKSRSSIKEMDNAISETYTEEELAEFERLDKEREANGLRTRF